MFPLPDDYDLRTQDRPFHEAIHAGRVDLGGLMLVTPDDGWSADSAHSTAARGWGYNRLPGALHVGGDTYDLPVGSALIAVHGQQVLAGTRLACWDPRWEPVFAASFGIVRVTRVRVKGAGPGHASNTAGEQLEIVYQGEVRQREGTGLDALVDVIDGEEVDVGTLLLRRPAARWLPPPSALQPDHAAHVQDTLRRFERDDPSSVANLIKCLGDPGGETLVDLLQGADAFAVQALVSAAPRGDAQWPRGAQVLRWRGERLVPTFHMAPGLSGPDDPRAPGARASAVRRFRQGVERWRALRSPAT